MSNAKKSELEVKANEIRKKTIDMIGFLGTGHIGGAMSVIEILTTLYYGKMKINPKNPKMNDRDKLILSKGHAGPALYAILADLGFFPEEWLRALNAGGTSLPSHCDMNKTPGIDMTTGSLGQGLSLGVGLALANRLDKNDRNIFVIIGDGESNEGQVWEAAMSAAHFKLDKLIAFTDYNKMQIDGTTAAVMELEDLEKKWEAFGWRVQRLDGHDLARLSEAVDDARENKGSPSMIICDTIKGKGCSFAEGLVGSHNMPFDTAMAQEAIGLLG